jgi:hypothetical protein
MPSQVKRSDQLGRYLVARGKTIAPDELILQENPIAVGPRAGGFPVCAGCGKDLESVAFKCTTCGWPLCGVMCEDAVLHQPECALCAPTKKDIEAMVEKPGMDLPIHKLNFQKM